MSELENLLATFEIANKDSLVRQLYIDLRCNWYSDVIGLFDEEEGVEICSKIARKVYDKEISYEEALKEGRQEILKLLK